eukprot:scaffold1747_cov251-Pinguiococcus_pyrenoidosus.AAC.2
MPPPADLIGRFQDQCDVQTSIYHDFRHDTGFGKRRGFGLESLGVNLKEYAKFCAREMGEGRRCDMRNNRMPWYLEGCGKPNALECFTRPVTACESRSSVYMCCVCFSSLFFFVSWEGKRGRKGKGKFEGS